MSVFVELSHCWLCREALLLGALNMTMKILYEAYFQSAYISVVIMFMFILTDARSCPVYCYLFL